MIYARRPDATACADFDIWNNRMNRYVRRGSKGIALLDESSGFPRLHYVFDVSDTGVRRNSRDPDLWQYNDDLKQPVSEMLAAIYGISGEHVSQQLADVAGKLVADYWDNNGGDIRAIVDGLLLMDYDEAGVEMQFKSAAAISVTYTLLERCGFEPTGWFDKDDFRAIHDFSTPDSVYALGAAVSDMSREVLRNIERTVKTTIRRRNNERSQHEYCASRKGFKVPLNFPVQASVPPLSGVFQQCIARRTKRLAPCPMHAPTIPAHHEGNGFDLLFLVQVLKSFLFYTQLVSSNRLVEEKAGHLYAVCLLPDAKARRRAGLTAPARARCRPVPSARCLAYTAPCCHRRTDPSW